MVEYVESKYWPCQERNCGRCCDPVKISFRKGMTFPDFLMPLDSKWNSIRIPLQEIRAPESNIDTIRIAVYECLLYDKKNKLCKDYNNRANACRNTSCIDKNCQNSIDEQYKNMIETSFIKMKK